MAKYNIYKAGKKLVTVEGVKLVVDGMGVRIMDEDGGVVFSHPDTSLTVLKDAELPTEE